MITRKRKLPLQRSLKRPAQAAKRITTAPGEDAPEDDPFSTVHPVRNPMAEYEDRPPAVAPTIKSITFTWLKCNPPKLVMDVVGEDSTGPWTNVKLVPWVYCVPPADGIWDFDLCGTDAGHLLFAPERICAQYDLGSPRPDDTTRKGVRIHGVNGGVLEKRFEETADRVALKGAVPAPKIGVAELAKFRVPLPTKGVVLYRAGGWELYFFFRNRGSKSDGATGVLLHDGSVQPASESPVETALGKLCYSEAGPELWMPWGWCREGLVPHSGDYPDLK